MITKEAYYESVLRNRELMEDPALRRCTCPNPLCDWHGRCEQCVAIHRYYGDHIPHCLQPIIADKVAALAATAELATAKKEGKPVAYREYVHEMDRKREQE